VPPTLRELRLVLPLPPRQLVLPPASPLVVRSSSLPSLPSSLCKFVQPYQSYQQQVHSGFNGIVRGYLNSLGVSNKSTNFGGVFDCFFKLASNF
jgi:hypothetical protein